MKDLQQEQQELATVEELSPIITEKDFSKLEELLKGKHPNIWDRLIDTEVERATYLMNLRSYESYIDKLHKELSNYSTMLIISGGSLLLIALCKMTQILQ